MKKESNWFLGELVGTFLLVFIGCSSVAIAVTHGALQGVFQVAAVWGLGLALAIYLTGGKSGAHLNPAVTIALTAFRGFPKSRVFGYFIAQFIGAILASVVLLLIYSGSIDAFKAEVVAGGKDGAEATKAILGGYFDTLRVSHLEAFFAELVGTALLVFVIFSLTHPKSNILPASCIPLAIGGTLIVLISLFGPMTNGCFNPARDLGPKIVASLSGWGSIPLKSQGIALLSVYVIAPIVGGLIGGWLAERFFAKEEDAEA